MINVKFLSLLNKEIQNKEKYTFRTMGGEKKQKGIVSLKLKIFNTENNIRFFVINEKYFKYDILLGLDCIKLFGLCQDHNLMISQYQGEIKEQKKNELNINSEMEVNYNERIPVEQFETKVNHLDVFKRKEIKKIINAYDSIFAKNKYDTGKVQNYEAHIKLLENKYITRKPYRCSFSDQEEIERQIKALLKYKIIEESDSPFAAPVTLAYKKEDGEKHKNRLCIDFRELNKIISPENFPFPLIDELIAKTQNSSWFSVFDINSAFWSIPIRHKDRYKTGFITQSGHYQWRYLPFGLKTCPAIFQRILSGIIRKHNLSSFCFNYLDDILMFSKSFDEHIEHLRKLLNAIKVEGFHLKFAKCSFATHSVKYLGHIIDKNTVRPLNDNLIAIKDFPRPNNRKNIRQFLGKVNFYHKFIKDSSKTLEPFHNLLRKNVPFIWSLECEEAFNKIKTYLTSIPVLAIFDRKAPIHIYTDASADGMGAILKQIQSDGSQKPVAYFSKRFNDTQKKKKAIYLECIAIKEAIKFWQYWLLGNKFTVFTDHKPLENLNIKSRTDEELGNLTNYLLQFDFTIKYRPGKDNMEADCLSRNPIETIQNEDTDLLRTTNTLTLNEIIKDQQANISSSNNIITKQNNIKYKQNTDRIILSKEMAKTLIDRVHHSFGHIGSKCMYVTIKKFYYFKNMINLINNHCRHCEVCIKNKTRKPVQLGTLGLLGPASKPFQIMSLDTIGGLGGRQSTKRYLHLVVDHFTRFAFILTSRTQNADDFIKIIDGIMKNNNINIELLLTDQYGGITSNEFQNYLQNQNIDTIFTAVDCAFSNGLNERLNQTLINRIRCKINEQKNNKAWTTIAKECVDEYNNTIHSSTGYAPKYLLYGDAKSILPKELHTPANLAEDRVQAFKNSLKVHKRNEKFYNCNRKDRVWNIGELVYVDTGNRLNRTKLDEIRHGPFPIHNIVSKHIVDVEIKSNPKTLRKYHVSKIVPMDN